MSERTDEIMKELGYEIRVKPVTTAPKTPEVTQIRDSFETPRYATELLIPFIPKDINSVWECACGSGKIVKALYESKDRPLICYCSDIKESNIRPINISNFLTDSPPMLFGKDWAIITNPPYSIKELFIEKAFEYGVPFAFLINMDYSAKSISWIQKGCQKIIPNRRIRFITPNIIKRVNEGEGTEYKTVEEIPQILLYNYSSSQFHSGWLTWGFNLPSSEVFVDLPLKAMKENII